MDVRRPVPDNTEAPASATGARDLAAEAMGGDRNGAASSVTPVASTVGVAAAALSGSVAMAVAMGFGRFSYTPILPHMMEELGLSAGAAGMIASSNYVGYLVGAVLAAYGWAAGRERQVATASLAASALLLLAMAGVENVAAFVLIRFLAGVASAFTMVFTTGIVLGAVAIRQTPQVQAVHFGGVGIGIALSSLMVGALASAGEGWRSGWIGGGLIGLAGLAFVLRFLPLTPPLARTGARAERREPPLVWTRRLVATTIGYGIFGFGYIVTATFLVAIVRANHGGVWFEAAVWLVTGLVGAPSVAYWLPFARRFGLMTTVLVGCLVEAVGVAASVTLPLPYGPLIGGALLGGTFMMVTAYGLQAGRQMAPESPRRALAFMTAAFGIGQIAGPLVAGTIAEFTGTFTLGSLAAAFALFLSAAIFLPVARAWPRA